MKNSSPMATTSMRDAGSTRTRREARLNERVLVQLWEPMQAPRCLLLDEPTASLDLAHQHTRNATSIRGIIIMSHPDAGVCTATGFMPYKTANANGLHLSGYLLDYPATTRLTFFGGNQDHGKEDKVLQEV